MADISKEIENFQNAIYGEEVRGSMIELARKVNEEAEAATGEAAASAQSADVAAKASEASAKAASKSAQESAAAANAARDVQTRADNGEFTAKIVSVHAETGEPEAGAAVRNEGTEQEARFVFTIPQGKTGEAGKAATIEIGTVDIGEEASVTNSGTEQEAIFNFIIPTANKDFYAKAEQEFYEWFGNLQTALSGDVAGNLQLQIETLAAGLQELSEMLMRGEALMMLTDSDNQALVTGEGLALLANNKLCTCAGG